MTKESTGTPGLTLAQQLEMDTARRELEACGDIIKIRAQYLQLLTLHLRTKTLTKELLRGDLAARVDAMS